MIIVEERIREIIEGIPKIFVNDDVTTKPKFHWGDRYELVKYLEINKDDSYPLIWLLLGIDNHTERGRLCTRECEFIIATRETDKSLMNDVRFNKSFTIVLNPLLEYILQGLNNSSISRIVEESWSVERRPDYTESYYKNDNDNYTIDLWDALKLTVEVEFNNHCLKTITWQAA
jgi:hypothetical protein